MTYYLNYRRLTEPGPGHRYLMRRLRLPDYYGRNLDALYDCVTDLPRGTKIVLYNARRGSGREAGFCAQVITVLQDAVKRRPDMALTFRRNLFC